jgi:hypothetical protein
MRYQFVFEAPTYTGQIVFTMTFPDDASIFDIIYQSYDAVQRVYPRALMVKSTLLED